MSAIISPENDSLGIKYASIKKRYKMPSFVKESSLSEIQSDKTEDLSPDVFGDPVHRKYPCHTKAATWLSCTYFTDDYEKLDPRRRRGIGDRLMKRAEYFGILNDVQSQIRQRSASLLKQAAKKEYPDSYYLFTTKTSGFRRGLLNSEAAINKAASWLVNNRNNLTLEKCSECAGRILKRANDLGMSQLDHRDRLERMLGVGIAEKSAMLRAIDDRAKLCKVSQLTRDIKRLASVMKNANLHSSDFMKVAKVLDSVDIAAQLVPLRKRGELDLPEDVIFRHSLTELKKFASDTVHLQSGEVYSLSKLAALDRIKFESEFGSDLADECFDDLQFRVKNASSVLATLPRPEAERIGAFFKNNGIEPEHTTKAASAVTIPQDMLDFFA